jgi:hypothetical protein
MQGRKASNGFDGSETMFSPGGVNGDVKGVSSLYEEYLLCWMEK